MKTNLRQHLLASTLLVGAAAFATPAMAQDQTVDPAAAPPSGPVEAQPTPSVSSEGEDVQSGGDITAALKQLFLKVVETAPHLTN